MHRQLHCLIWYLPVASAARISRSWNISSMSFIAISLAKVTHYLVECKKECTIYIDSLDIRPHVWKYIHWLIQYTWSLLLVEKLKNAPRRTTWYPPTEAIAGIGYRVQRYSLIIENCSNLPDMLTRLVSYPPGFKVWPVVACICTEIGYFITGDGPSLDSSHQNRYSKT